MDYDKLIERLEAWNEQHLSVVCGSGYFACDYFCENEDCIVARAASALSTLQAENEKLRAELADLRAQWDMYGGDDGITATYAELERVKAERDAAISDLERETFGTPRACDCCKHKKGSQCKRNLLYGWCKWEWRSQKED